MSNELAWAAGFFDGEGSTMLKHRRSGHWCRVEMSISQTEPTTLHRFKQAVGEGRVHGPYPNSNGHSPRWFWSTEGALRCADVLEKLWPYLSAPKRAQAEAVASAYDEYQISLRRKPQ